MVSVVVPTHNRRELLAQALQSVYAQRDCEFEVLVCLDRCGDGSAELVAERFPAARLVNVTGGSSAARNRGIQLARGEFVAFLDDDDLWEPGFLRTQLEALQASPEAVLSFCDHYVLHPGGRKTRPSLAPVFHYTDAAEHLASESYIHTMSLVVCRRRALLDAGEMREDLAVIHDLDLYCRLSRLGKFVYVAQPLVVRRLQGARLSGDLERWEAEERRWRAEFGCNQRIETHRDLFFSSLYLNRGQWAPAFERLWRALRRRPLQTLWTLVFKAWGRMTASLIRATSNAGIEPRLPRRSSTHGATPAEPPIASRTTSRRGGP